MKAMRQIDTMLERAPPARLSSHHMDEHAERRHEACGGCRFWRRDRDVERGPDWGQCRRMPPTLPPIEQEKLLHVGIWPHTAEDDWCGEWQAAGEAGQGP